VLTYAHRLPALATALPLRGASVALALVLVPLGAYGGYVALARSSAFDVHSIAVRGGDASLDAQARGVLMTAIDGRSLLQVSSSSLAHRLTELPRVQAAYVDRDFPNTLRVRLVEERPVAVARIGRSYVELSGRGRVLGMLPLHPRPSLPAVVVALPATAQAPTAGSFLRDRNGLAALDVVRALPSDFGGRVVRVSEDDHGALTARLEIGLDVRLGPDLDLARKLSVASLFLQRFGPSARSGLTYVDVSSPDHPVVCPRGGDPATAPSAGLTGGVSGGPCMPPSTTSTSTTGTSTAGASSTTTSATTGGASTTTATTSSTTQPTDTTTSTTQQPSTTG
jgi:cell division septal protein FtsQ